MLAASSRLFSLGCDTELGKFKVAQTAARAKANQDHVAGTQPSHPLADYVGSFEHPLYPRLGIAKATDAGLSLAFRASVLPLVHVHYDRFDTPDDEVYGKWSVNFGSDPQGEISTLTMTLDEAEVVFKRCPEPVDPTFASAAVGTYATPSGFRCYVVQKEAGQLFLQVPGELDRPLQAYRPQEFRSPAVSNMVYRFDMDAGVITGLTLKYPGGETSLVRL